MVPGGVVQERRNIRLLVECEGEIVGPGDQWAAWRFSSPVRRQRIVIIIVFGSNKVRCLRPQILWQSR